MNSHNFARSIDPQVKAVLEPSANYWIKAYDQLEDEGTEIKLSNSLRTKAMAKARIKTGRLDARRGISVTSRCEFGSEKG